VPPGVAFTNRTFRYLATRAPDQRGRQPARAFSILNDPGVDPRTG